MKLKKAMLIGFMLVCLLPVAACGGMSGGKSAKDTNTETAENKTKAVYKRITAKQAKERMDSSDNVIILDVRTKEEYDEGHIPGAILIPNETIIRTRPKELPDLDAEILVYCRSGRRSEEAARKLIAMGYTNVYDFGGIISWDYDIVAE